MAATLVRKLLVRAIRCETIKLTCIETDSELAGNEMSVTSSLAKHRLA